MTDINMMAFMPKKRTVLAAAMVAALGLGGMTFSAIAAETSTTTVTAQFVLDRTEVSVGDVANLSLMGLNAAGEIDQLGEQQNSILVVTVTSLKGKVNNDAVVTKAVTTAPGDATTGTGTFEATTKYIHLEQGLGRVYISYADATPGEDTVTVTLQERYETGTGGRLSRIIKTETKKINVIAAQRNIGALDITNFTKAATESLTSNGVDTASSEGAGTVDLTDGVDGVMTAGVAGGQVVVEACPTGKVTYDDTNGGNEIIGCSGTAAESKASGKVTLTLTGKVTGQIYTVEGDMAKGVATITLPSTITKADTYYMKAELADYAGSTVDMVEADTLKVINTGSAKKASLSSNMARVEADDVDGNNHAALSLVLLDAYGNKITAFGKSYTMKVSDSKGILTSKSFTGSDSASLNVALGNTAAGNFIPTATKSGDVALSATVTSPENSGVSASDEATVSLVGDRLAVSINTTATDAFTADKPAATGFTLFNIGKNATTTALSNSDPKVIIVDHYDTLGNKLETQTLTVKQGETTVKAAFNVAKVNDSGYFMVSDNEGLLGQAKIASPYSIIPAQASTGEMVDGHGSARTSITRFMDVTGATPEKVARVWSKNLVLIDAKGNRITDTAKTGSFSVKSKGALGTTGAVTPTTVADTGAGYGSVTYTAKVAEIPTARAADPYEGDDTIQVLFTDQPTTSPLELSTTVPALSTLTKIDAYVEQTAIPVNGEVALTVMRKDQNGLAYTGDVDIRADYSGGITPTVTYLDYYTGTKTLATGDNIQFKNAANVTNSREVLVVNAGGATGDFTITFQTADGKVKTERKFTVTKALVTECAPGVLTACTTEAECTTTGKGTWDAATSVCSASTTPTEDDTDLGTTALDKDGNVITTTTKFKGGVKVGDDGDQKAEAAITKDDSVTIETTVTVDPAHVDKMAETLQVAVFIHPAVPNGIMFFMKDHGEWKVWPLTADGGLDIAGLAAATDAAALTDPLAIDVYTGVLPFPDSQIWVYTGYRITGPEGDALVGAMAFNPTPIKITITE